MVDMLTEEQVQEYKDSFSLFDKDADGFINVEELGVVLRSLGQHPNQVELDDMIEEVDADGNLEIDFQEFLCLMARTQKESESDEELTEAFNLFDRDGNGFISFDEMKHVLMKIGQKLTEPEVVELFKEADIDGDNCINYEEFVRLVMSR